METDNGSIAFEQSRLTLECRKLYKDNMTAEKFLDKDLLQWYGAQGWISTMSDVVEIDQCLYKVIIKIWLKNRQQFVNATKRGSRSQGVTW